VLESVTQHNGVRRACQGVGSRQTREGEMRKREGPENMAEAGASLGFVGQLNIPEVRQRGSSI
jgi:hypothetical protein